MTAQPDSVTDNVAIKGVFVGCPIPDAPPHIHRLNLLFPYRHWSKAVSYTHLDVYKRQHDHAFTVQGVIHLREHPRFGNPLQLIGR